MKKITLVFLLFAHGCAKEKVWQEYIGSTIEIQYDVLNIKSIDQEDIFWVDQIKISHNKNEISSTKNNIVLPIPKYVVTRIKEREFSNYANPITYALRLHNALLNYSNDYEMLRLPLLQSQGILTLRSKTNDPIRVKIKPEYPLTIKVIKK